MTIVTAASVDPESLKAAVEQYFESLRTSCRPRRSTRPRHRSISSSLKVTERAELVLDVATGIPDRLSYEKRRKSTVRPRPSAAPCVGNNPAGSGRETARCQIVI
ncbi:hypothetical protein E6W36_11400 [Hankyongella ginsenosidimutans]|uniref:Uncharacterized protein n=1 Tax=Hankyongella ginsenosidimutans TaxID=1763828 RepID=A0A4D7C7B7_9SPHN|nr:hypothetical protein [Hankyongella ginsenosidimutans]QCI79890.1 hypothetical protein E6W36_11400 [Hankyongella ginsenosidimutans]